MPALVFNMSDWLKSVMKQNVTMIRHAVKTQLAFRTANRYTDGIYAPEKEMSQ